LLNYITLPVLLISIIRSLYKREISDKIILTWLGLGYLGGLSGVRFYDTRFIIVTLPAFIVFISIFIVKIFNYGGKPPFLKRRFFQSIAIAFLGFLIVSEFCQLINYYYTAPFNLDECRFNSYGCKEAAQYLSRVKDLKDSKIENDILMEPFDIYLDYYLNNFNLEKKNEQQSVKPKTKIIYYLIWSPESHPSEFRSGIYRQAYDSFIKEYPNKIPINKIYYPNGITAIYIYKIKEA
jgi:hypothetical protein